MSARSKIVRDFSGQEVAIPYDPRDDAQHTPGPIDWSGVEAPNVIAAYPAAHAEIVRRWEAHEIIVEALRDLLEQLEFIGIYIPGEGEGQWADAAGISFREAETALKGE